MKTFINFKKILWENVGVRQTIFKNTFWLVFADVINRFLSLILIIFSARILGPIEYGKFSFALSFVSLLVIFADLGISDITTRELSQGKERDYPSILSLILFLSTITFIISFIGSYLITKNWALRGVILLLMIFILISNFLGILFSLFRAKQKMQYEAIIKIFQLLLVTTFSLFVLFTIPSIKNLSLAYLFANLIVLILLILFFLFKNYPLRLDWNIAFWKEFLKISWPLSFGFSFGWLYVLIDSTMLGYFEKMAEVGWYNAASKIITNFFVLGSLICISFYPSLSKFLIENKNKLYLLWNYLIAGMIVISLPLVAGGILLASPFIKFFYGLEFLPSIFVFQILLIVVGIVFLHYPFALALVIFNYQKVNFYLILFGTIINIILNFILIPFYHIRGAAIATLISSLVVFLFTIFYVKKLTDLPLFRIQLLKFFLVTFFASIAMIMVIFIPFIHELNIIFSILVGFLVFIGILLFFYKIYPTFF